MKYEIVATEGRAKSAHMETVHGTIETPVFMNVGTVGAIKGAVSTRDLEDIGCQVELSNTYHLHVRTGDELIKELGGLHRFMDWHRPILTDSGGFQVFSLTSLRKIKEEGVYFSSHIDGRKIFMGPEESMRIQSNLGSTIAMAFDECPPALAERSYIEQSVARTARWLKRCKDEMQRLNSLPDTINREQLLFGINQGGILHDVRMEHARIISEMDCDGYAIGGLAVGESHEEMYRILEAAGLEQRGLPTLRHTFATNLVNGVKQPDGTSRSLSLRQVAHLLGHSTSEITELCYVKKDTSRLAGITAGFDLCGAPKKTRPLTGNQPARGAKF